MQPYTRVTLYTAGHLHTAVPHCSHSRAPIVHTAVPRENNEHGCVYLRCRAVCKLPGCVEGHPWYTSGLVPDSGIPNANTLETLQFCTNPSIYTATELPGFISCHGCDTSSCVTVLIEKMCRWLLAWKSSCMLKQISIPRISNHLDAICHCFRDIWIKITQFFCQ